jgi:hypothetical protein
VKKSLEVWEEKKSSMFLWLGPYWSTQGPKCWNIFIMFILRRKLSSIPYSLGNQQQHILRVTLELARSLDILRTCLDFDRKFLNWLCSDLDSQISKNRGMTDNGDVKCPTSTVRWSEDEFISRCNTHLTNHFCTVELDQTPNFKWADQKRAPSGSNPMRQNHVPSY